LIRTDHFSLMHLLDQRLSMIPQHQWVSKLIGFDFRVEYRPRKSNFMADALSHHDTAEDGEVVALSAPTFAIFDGLCTELVTDPVLQELKQQTAAGTKGAKWCLVDDLIMVQDRVYMPPESVFLLDLLQHAHGAGHEGTEKTLHRLR
jgi:hypothetical protein